MKFEELNNRQIKVFTLEDNENEFIIVEFIEDFTDEFINKIKVIITVDDLFNYLNQEELVNKRIKIVD